MNNLTNTEKNLKHWLKNRVSVTTATIVGFLIMGTVSFGVEKTPNLNTSNGSIILEDKNFNDTFENLFGSKTYLNTNNITATNGTSAIKIDNVKTNGATFENEGATISSKLNGTSNGILIEKNVNEITIRNKNSKSGTGIIDVESLGNNGSFAWGINSSAKETTITNYGEIKVKHKQGLAQGIGVENTFNIYNTGKIIVEGQNGGTGITVVNINGVNKSSIENNGEITVKAHGGAAQGIHTTGTITQDLKNNKY